MSCGSLHPQHLAGRLAHAETVCRACTDAADPRRCFDQAQQNGIFALNNCPEGTRHCGLTENKMQQTGLFPFGQYLLPYLTHPGWGLLAFPGKKDVKKRNQKAASVVWAQIPRSIPYSDFCLAYLCGNSSVMQRQVAWATLTRETNASFAILVLPWCAPRSI